MEKSSGFLDAFYGNDGLISSYEQRKYAEATAPGGVIQEYLQQLKELAKQEAVYHHVIKRPRPGRIPRNGAESNYDDATLEKYKEVRAARERDLESLARDLGYVTKISSPGTWYETKYLTKGDGIVGTEHVLQSTSEPSAFDPVNLPEVFSSISGDGVLWSHRFLEVFGKVMDHDGGRAEWDGLWGSHNWSVDDGVFADVFATLLEMDRRAVCEHVGRDRLGLHDGTGGADLCNKERAPRYNPTDDPCLAYLEGTRVLLMDRVWKNFSDEQGAAALQIFVDAYDPAKLSAEKAPALNTQYHHKASELIKEVFISGSS